MADNPETILVVDDSATSRQKTALAVKHLGYRVETADNGRLAMDKLLAAPFDLVLLDLSMPEIDGFGVLQLIMEQDALRDIPVVIVSAINEMDSIVRCIELGAEDYLFKPFSGVLLRARVSACLEKKRLRESIVTQLGRYIPETVATAIIHGREKLEPKRTVATTFFTDIANFTSISERLPPQHVFEMLNEYFSVVVEPVVENGGVVNQFLGDAMLVTFNVPATDPQHADNAVKAALMLQDRLRNRKFAGIELNTRIGINTGELVAGNVGAGSRYNYTVLGDAVNLAARLEQLNKQHGTEILISEFTRNHLQAEYNVTSLGEITVRGKSRSVEIFRVT